MERSDTRQEPGGSPDSHGQILRRRAEDLVREKLKLPPRVLDALSTEDMQQMLRQLQVHQVELELQNEELRRTQWQLNTTRARYFDLYDRAPVGYCTISEQGVFLEANLMAAQLLGRLRDTLVKQPISRFIHKADQEIYYDHLKLLMETGETQACDLRLMNGNKPFWANLTTTVDKDARGAVVYRVVMSDISERKRAENAIRDSEERYRNLFNSIYEGFCVIEIINEEGKPVDFRYLEVNPSFEQHSGLANVTGKRILEIDPAYPTSWIDLFSNVARTGEQIRFVKFVESMERWFNVFAFRIGGPESRKVAIIFNNITEQRLAEIERIRLNQTLLHKNIDLENAIAGADKANRAKSEFLSGMSHELRTPLSAILGFAQLIESGTPPPTESQARSLEQILKAGWYLLELINEILDLALIESGKLSLSLESVPLAAILDECATMIEPQAQRHGVRVTFPPQDSRLLVKADRMRLKQVLINLLSNAIKYNRPSGTVVVSCAETTPGRVRVTVEDTGHGLSPEKIGHLFQPFNRLGQEKTTAEGTGIGLVMTKRMVELMGGEIGVESVVGKGSRFWFEINRENGNEATGALPASTSDSGVGARPGSRTLNLLYVEDNLANVMLIEEVIGRCPEINLLTAPNGARGIETAVAARPDVILMDINLPDISGLKVLDILAKNPETAHIPVIALSANAMPGDIKKGLEAGFFRYLTKPIKLDEFMSTLDAALELSRNEINRGNSREKNDA